jgi:hypothetical protein
LPRLLSSSTLLGEQEYKKETKTQTDINVTFITCKIWGKGKRRLSNHLKTKNPVDRVYKR